jgi:hypothetical protein
MCGLLCFRCCLLARPPWRAWRDHPVSPCNNLAGQRIDVCAFCAFCAREVLPDDRGQVLVAQIVNRAVEPFSFRLCSCWVPPVGDLVAWGAILARLYCPPKKKTPPRTAAATSKEPLFARSGRRRGWRGKSPAGRATGTTWAVSSDTLLAPPAMLAGGEALGHALPGEHPQIANSALQDHLSTGGSTTDPRTGQSLAGLAARKRPKRTPTAPTARAIRPVRPRSQHGARRISVLLRTLPNIVR